MKFMFEWQEQCAQARYCSYNKKILLLVFTASVPSKDNTDDGVFQ